MDVLKRVSKVYESALEIPFDDSSKLVLMSDCHRGDGSWSDEFMKNQNIYFAALMQYYNKNYTYIEIGDGDELWENRKLSEIMNVHSDAFWILSQFYKDGRLYFIFGNHDIIKKSKIFVRNNLYKYFNEREKKYIQMFNNIKLHEGIVLNYQVTNDKILLIHGHQVDNLNSAIWLLSRFLVRYLWRPLQLLGAEDPTSAAKNYEKRAAIDKNLIKWVSREKHMLIAGHTHRPVFPEPDQVPYFNDGSCVHPRCITAIEIEYGYIALVKWSIKTNSDSTLYIGRDVLAGPVRIRNYFDSVNSLGDYKK